MSDYYYHRLTDHEKKIYQKVRNAVQTYKSTVQVMGVQRKRFGEIITMVCWDNPGIFYVDFTRLTLGEMPGVGILWKISYLYPISEINVRDSALNQKIDGILRSRKTAAGVETTVGICRWIHDLLVKNVEYQMEALTNPGNFPEAFNIVGVFEYKKAVCQGISLAAMLLAERLGAEMAVIAGRGLSDNPAPNAKHLWNAVKMQGQTAYIDITWDLCISRPARYVRYDYFCFSEQDMLIDHETAEVCGQSQVRSGSTGAKNPVVHDGWNLGQSTGTSYFELTNHNFTEFKQCTDYMLKALQQGQDTFYFRCRSKQESGEELGQRLIGFLQFQQACRMMLGTRLEINHNLKQGIYFFRLKTGN